MDGVSRHSINIRVQSQLPFVTVTLKANGKEVQIDALLDTGSAGSVFDIDAVASIGLQMELDDMLIPIRGIGGTDFVAEKYVDAISVGSKSAERFKIEIGKLDYGYGIQGIVGFDLLRSLNAILDLEKLELR